MTQKEFDIINAINVDGIDNSDWGVTEDGLDTEYYGIELDKPEQLPRHIYVWGDTKQTYGKELNELLCNGYDRKYRTDDTGGFLCLFWLDPQTL